MLSKSEFERNEDTIYDHLVTDCRVKVKIYKI